MHYTLDDQVTVRLPIDYRYHISGYYFIIELFKEHHSYENKSLRMILMQLHFIK